jgi:hypothetical protein
MLELTRESLPPSSEDVRARLQAFAKTTTIKSISMIGIDYDKNREWLGPEVFVTLIKNPAVETLFWNNNFLNRDTFPQLIQNKTLTALSIDRCAMIERGPKELFRGGALSDDDIETLSRNNALRSLSVADNSLTPRAGELLARIPSLVHLRINNNKHIGNGVHALLNKSGVPLQTLSCYKCEIPSEGMLALVTNSDLSTLNVLDDNQEEDTLKAFEKNSSITNLLLTIPAKISEETVATFSKNPNIVYGGADNHFYYSRDISPERQQRLNKILPRNQRSLRTWKRVVALLAGLRAVAGHPLRDSFLDIMKYEFDPLLEKDSEDYNYTDSPLFS